MLGMLETLSEAWLMYNDSKSECFVHIHKVVVVHHQNSLVYEFTDGRDLLSFLLVCSDGSLDLNNSSK